jgi:hypothetical protein
VKFKTQRPPRNNGKEKGSEDGAAGKREGNGSRKVCMIPVRTTENTVQNIFLNYIFLQSTYVFSHTLLVTTA